METLHSRRALRPMPPAQAGFTLIELLAVVAVLAVLLGLAVPWAAAIGGSARLSAFSNAFVGHLRLARSEAIKRNARVVLCKSADGQGCASSGGWDQGWIVFHDADNDGARDAGEAIIDRSEALPGGLHFAGNLHVSRYVSFSPTGGTRLVSGAFQAGTLTLCRGAGQEGRQIVLNSVGRPRIEKLNVSACD